MFKRRLFLKKSVAGALSLCFGVKAADADGLPSGMNPPLPADPYERFAKHKDMVVLNDRPWNMEAQAHLLNDAVTPASKMFIRNNGKMPKHTDAEQWTLTVDGESAIQPKKYTLLALKRRFKAHTYQLTLECGGNGRSEFDPPAQGNQWTVGAVSCARWTGARLRDILEDVGIRSDAVYVGYYGKDSHLSGDLNKSPISRGVPVSKAVMDETLMAYAMNGRDIPPVHGHPLRLVAGGWPASASGKWVNRLRIRNKVHDGAKMNGSSYRVPCHPVAPGAKVSDKDMCIIESMPVKSLITYPKTGAIVRTGQSLHINGHAWAGELEVAEMQYSINFGAAWHNCRLQPPVNRLAWQQWSAEVAFPNKGYYEIWAKATDSAGVAQPVVMPGWNPKGYLNNACHRIAVRIED